MVLILFLCFSYISIFLYWYFSACTYYSTDQRKVQELSDDQFSQVRPYRRKNGRTKAPIL